jgi:N-acetylmuramoyl-L-alanine amidase
LLNSSPSRTPPAAPATGRALEVALVLLLTSFATNALAASRTSGPHIAKLTAWEQAERGREQLESTPEDARTRADYTAAMDRFRELYHDNPRDVHAAPSVFAVAELLAEQGRSLHDPKSFKSAVGQYEFLRTQYPGSSLRVPALLAEAQIEENDLRDDTAARERYRLLLKQYPHSELAEEARAGLEGIDSDRKRLAPTEAAAIPAAAPAADILVPVQARTITSTAASQPAESTDDAAIPSPLDGSALPASAHKPGETVTRHRSGRSGSLAQVKGIRHWSTPTYTRVAIDLGDDVTFEAARVPNPDRIYFDLHGTRLAQELVGKSFAVTDDGFLKKIRAAQFSDNMTRVVLDVNDVSEYSAFLLPNPYRLIIDIHGGTRTTGPTAAPSGPPAATLSARATGLESAIQPATASTLPSTPPTSAKPAISGSNPTVPNTVAVRSANSIDVAALSQQPGRVDATSHPTSKPISAVVADRVPDPVYLPNQQSQAPSAPVTKKRTKAKSVDSIAAGDALPARAAVPAADGSTSLVRALGLKIGRIVIDAGHGGHDSGTIGADGIEEKDVVLDVALRLGKLLHERLGAEIVYTRSDDTFIPLETRTAIANKAQADLFISVHANSSSDPTARGVETYYLNFTTSPDALQTAARENAVSNQSIHQLSDLVKKITLRDKIDESREFASDVEDSLYSGLQKGNAGLKNRGVKKAPFVVLIGANMPSILAEISFVTNPRDASQLQRPEYRERVAESLYKGVARYEAGLSGVKASTLSASVATK